MKLLHKFILIFVCIALLTVPVSAAAGIQSVQTDAVVASDGSCRVTLRFYLRLEQEEKLELPLPLQAEDIQFNGKYRTPVTETTRRVLQLPKMGPGLHTVEVSFTLPCALTTKSGSLYLELLLLTGFAYPVEEFSFTVVFPNELQADPSFSSGYHGESILSDLQIHVSGNTVSGTSLVPLKDHETLKLTYRGNSAMFPQYSARQPLLNGWQFVVLGLMAVAVLYYLVALLPIIPRKIRSFSPPEGLSAGDLGTCLTGCGIDLTMLVFSWAQLGYLSIETGSRGKVLLHKRMEMGSERPNLEIRCFQLLFGHQQTVDGCGMHYARLCRKMSSKSHLLRQIYRSRSGNPNIVRMLSVAAGVCSGVLLSQGVYTAGAGTVLLALAMALATGLLSWGIQSSTKCLPLGNKLPIWMGIFCVAVYVAVGYLMNSLMLALVMVAYESVMGLLAAIGGRRSEAGQHYVAQIRGLRSHLTQASVFDMQQCLDKNPTYFFELMPYALALGVEKRFARRFGKVTVAECSYLTAPIRGELTPAQWAGLLRQVADRLNRRQRRLKYEQLLQQAELIVKTK